MSGGAGMFRGANLQATFAAWCAVLALAENRDQLFEAVGSVAVERVGAEQNWPIDDNALWLSGNVRAFVQVKETLDSSTREESDYADVWSQIIRQSIHGRGRAAGEEPLSAPDRFLIVVGRGTGRPVREELREVLLRLETHPASEPLLGAALGQFRLEKQLATAISHMKRTLEANGHASSEADLRSILQRCRIVPVSREELRERARLLLSTTVLESDQHSVAVFDSLEALFATAGQNRTSYDVFDLRLFLNERGHRLASPRSIRADVEALNLNTARLLGRRPRFIGAPECEISVQREIVPDLIAEARLRNVAITSQGGGGKTGVMVQTAKVLHDLGERVVFIDASIVNAIDLASSLRLQHPFEDVLSRWAQENRPSFLLIDGFDAFRLGRSADSLLAIIEMLASTAPNWRVVIASRLYDLESFPSIARAFPSAPDTVASASVRDDLRFAHISHLTIGDFSDAELDIIASRSPALRQVLGTAAQELRAVLRNPFNLSVAADIISQGADLSTARGRLDLLDLWWRHKIELADRFERQAALGSIVRAMIDARRLQIPAEHTGAVTTLRRLLHDGVLITLGPDVDDIAFPHALLFDYIVYRTVLASPNDVISLLRLDRDAFVFVLPSIRFRFEALWDSDRGQFFSLLAEIFSEEHSQRLALLVLAALVIAERTRSMEDLSWLVQHDDSSTRRTVRFLVRALIRSRQLGEPYLAARSGVFAMFALQLARTALHFHHDALLILNELTEHVEQSRTDSSVVDAARYILTAQLDDPNAYPTLRTMAIDAFLRTYDADAVGGRPILGRLLDPERLSVYGPSDLNTIGYHFSYVESLEARDFAYQVIFSRISFSDGQVGMGAPSALFGLSQNASQPLRSAQWAFAEMYTSVLDASPDVAVRALRAALVEGSHSEQSGSYTFNIAGADRFFGYDYDAHSDAIYSVEDWRRMLTRFEEKLRESLASDDRSYVDAILREAANAPIPATFLRLLLRNADRNAELAEDLAPIVTMRSVLRSYDLGGAVADYLAGALPGLSYESRARVEDALYDLAVEAVDEPRRRAYDRRLGAYLDSIPEGIIENPELIRRKHERDGETVDVEERSLALHGSYIGAGTTRALTIGDGVDDPEIRSYLDEANELMPHSGVSPAPERLLPLARTLEALLPSATGEDRERILDVAIALLGWALDKNHVQPSEMQQFSELISLAARGAHPTGPPPADDDEASRWGWPNARILAAQVIGHIGTTASAADFALLRELAADEAPEVRGRAVESVIGWVSSRSDEGWEIVEAALRDRSLSVVNSAIRVASRLSSLNPSRYAALEISLYNRLILEYPNAELTASLQRNLLWRALDGETEAENRLGRLLSHPWEDAQHGQRLALDLVNLLAHRDSAKRVSARDRLTQLLQSVIAHIRSEAAAAGLESDEHFTLTDPTRASHETRLACARLLIEVAQRLYFDSGAYAALEGRSRQPGRTQDFACASFELVKPLIELLVAIPYSQISYELLKILTVAIPCDPGVVLNLGGAAIFAGRRDNLAREHLAQQEAAKFVRRYIESYRGLLTSSRDALGVIMDIIDTFADAGWPEWNDLVLMIVSIYRD